MKLQTNGTTGLPCINDNGSGFSWKSIVLQHVFYLTVALKRKKLKWAK